LFLFDTIFRKQKTGVGKCRRVRQSEYRIVLKAYKYKQKMTEEEKIEIIRKAYETFKDKMTDIRKRQLSLFDRIDKISSKEKADKLRDKINNC